MSPGRPIALVVVLMALLMSACSGSDTVDDAAGEPASDGITGADCENIHAGHSAMMWNPTMADEMIDADCGWPYEPFLVSLEGGEDDPDLTAPFEAQRFDQLWSAISASGVGVCSVGTDLEGDQVGRAFGFTYRVGPPGCPDATSTGALAVAEFGTEAQRDAAAVEQASTGVDTFVLGRWVVSIDGETASLADSLGELGAQQVT